MAEVPSSETKTLGWCLEALQEGDAFLRQQKGWSKIDDAISSIMGENFDLRAAPLSQTTCNLVSKVALSLVANLTDTKPFWEYKTQNKRYEQTCTMQGKMALHWYLQRFIDIRQADVIKYSLAAGTGYAHHIYDELIDDLDVLPEDPRDVVPIRPNSNMTLQDSFGIIIRRERTVNYVRSKFPDMADYIVADRDGSLVDNANTRFGRLMDKLGVNPFRERLFGSASQKKLPRIPTVDVYTLYLDDPTINEGSTKKMGDWDGDTPRTNWSYEVKKGERLYPRKRLLVFTRTKVLYDGPSPYWHGLFPVTKFTIDPWPWTFLGRAPLWDIIPLQVALNGALRVADDYLGQLARPAVIADKNSMSEAALGKIDTRKAGLKIRYNAGVGEGVKIERPQPLPPDFFNLVGFYKDMMHDLVGVNEMNQLLRLNQMPAEDSIERILESMSAQVRLRSRYLEAYMREFAMITAYNMVQFYTLKKRIIIAGVEGITPEDFDFDPSTILPDYTDEDYDQGILKPDAVARGPKPRMERSREFMAQISYHVAPGSMLAASEVQSKMMYLQLARAGLIDRWTLLEKLDIPNVGVPPMGANSITDRLVAEQNLGLGMSVSAAGRKATGQELPRMKMSESG